jgi:hypothetical protein
MRYHGGHGGHTEDTDNQPLVPADPASDALLQVRDVKVDQKTNAFVTQLQVRQELRFVDGKYLLDRLHFDDDGIFDQKIDSVSELERNAIVLNGKRLLGFECDMQLCQFVSEAGTVWTFEEPWPELGMDSERSAKNAFCDPAMYELISVPSVRVRVLRGSAFLKQATHHP